MKFNSIYNPVWANAEHSAINVMIDTDSLKTPTIPFTASPTDDTEYGPAIFQAASDGVFGEIAEYIAPVVTPEQILLRNAAIYNRLMRACTDAAFPLQSAVSRGVATEEQIARLDQLQEYAANLLEVDLSQSPLSLPPPPAELAFLK